MSQRPTKDQIAHLIDSYYKRGPVTRDAFCKANGIAKSTLGHYLRRHRERGAPQRAFVEVAVQPERRTGAFALILANGRRIECGEAELAQLIRTAESC
jgi:hypothetical protein